MTDALSISLAIASMFGFGFSDFFAKTIVSKASAYRTVLVSQAVGTVPFLALTAVYDFAVPDVSLLLLAILSGGLSSFYLLSFYKALSLGKASLVTPISSCLIVVAVVLSVSILGETLSLTQILLIAIVFSGVLLIALQKTAARSSASDASIMLSLVVVFGAGSNTIVQKWIAQSGHLLLGFLFTRFAMLSVLAALFPMFSTDEGLRVSTGYRRIVFLGLLDVFAFFAWFLSLREGYVSILAPITNSSAVITTILAYIFLKERVHLHQTIGIVAVILGIVLLSAVS
jgi:uncharacterized membrane protein